MALIVQKFGGRSVADADKVRNVARIVTETYRKGHSVVVVLSAQGDTTDDLIEKAREIHPGASKREMDMLLATGEQISISLCAMAIERMGYQAVSLTGWQAGMLTDSAYSAARIKRVRAERIQKELDKKKIVLVAGFQGINKYDDITTLGRGGSDTSAVALATALHADLCQIYTDVDGVYTADPRYVTGARKIDEITYDEMLELASLGAQVLHNRSVEMAKRYSVNLEVLSSFSGKPGTKVKEVVKTMEKTHVSGVAKDKDVARIALVELADQPRTASQTAPLPATKQCGHHPPVHRPGRQQGYQLYRGGGRRPDRQRADGGAQGGHRLQVYRGQHRGGQGVYRGRGYGPQRRRGQQDVRGPVLCRHQY